MFNNQIIAGSSGQGGSFYPYSIDQSLRFDGSSAYLNFTPSSSTTGTVTISAWVKRSKLGVTQYLFASGVVNARGSIGFNASDQLFFQGFNSSGANSVLTSSMLFRDVSAWYHIVIECDGVTTTSNFPTNTNVYVNGSTISMTHSTASSPSGGFRINDTQVKHIGALTPTASSYLSAYMAEVHWIDGTAVDASNFGETIGGVWVPKAYSGSSYGSAGYYLSFADSAAIGDDLSGNTNDWTANNLAAHDVVPDSPSGNNFATLNVNFPHVSMTFSEGNLKWSTTGNQKGAMGNFSIPIGTGQKYYFEYVQNGWGNTSGDDAYIGLNIDTVDIDATRGGYTTSYSYQANQGNKRIAGSETSYGTAWGTGDVIGIAVDRENNTINFAKNNTFHGTFAIPATGNLFAWIGSGGGSNNANGVFNFGQDSSFANTKSSGSSNATDDNGIGDFYYTPPSGFLALCTANLLEPTIGSNSAKQADDYFDIILYTAATSNGTYTHGNLSFRPDFSWIKNRNNAERHFLIDVVRGNTSVTDKFLVSSDTSAEGANGVSGTTFSVTDTGYEFVETSINSGELYFNNRTYVGWNWKAGGTAVSNTDGSITSSVSAAPDAGFAVGTFSGTGANATIGHGLSIAPEMIIVKSRTQSGTQWPVYHKYIASDAETDHLFLNGTDAAGDAATYWNDTAPTASVFSVGTAQNTNNSGEDLVFYAFHSVPGYSAVGSYVGNGSADGPFVFTGHRVKWLMVKNTNNAATSWWIMDTKRSTFNVMNDFLFPNLSNAESASTVLFADFLSNGFKIRNGTYGETNASGNTYIYLAFAEAPFKYANAR